MMFLIFNVSLTARYSVHGSQREGRHGVDQAFYDICSRALKKSSTGDDWSNVVKEDGVVRIDAKSKDNGGCCN